MYTKLSLDIVLQMCILSAQWDIVKLSIISTRKYSPNQRDLLISGMLFSKVS